MRSWLRCPAPVLRPTSQFRRRDIALRFAALLSLACICGCSSPPSSAPDDERGPVEFEQLAPGVWMHVSFETMPPWGRIRSNGLVVASGEDEALLIDTAWTDPQTAEVIDWVRDELGRRVTAAVLTHAHRDKMGGVGTLRDAGIATFANARSNELAPSRGLVAAEHDLRFRADGSVEAPIDALRGLSIFYPGPAHTEDNIVAYVDGADVLFGGCLVRPGGSRSLGNTADGNIAQWGIAAERIEQRFPRSGVVIPSHGPPGDRSLLRHTAELARNHAGLEQGERNDR